MVSRSPWWLAALALLAPASGSGEQRPQSAEEASTLDRVLVYSDQARVVHRVTVKLAPAVSQGQERRFELVDLPPQAMADTLRVTSQSADIIRVEVRRAAGRMPRRDQVRRLATRVEALVDELRDLADERQVLEGELALVASLGLRREPAGARGRAAPEGLFAGAWGQIVAWTGRREATVRARLRAIADARHAKAQALHALQVEAQALGLGASAEVVPRVEAVLGGRPGEHVVEVSYRVAGASWRPSYDLRYDAARRRVEATYYARVAQQSGEDWSRARVRLSTGLPTQLLAIPELPTMTLGRKRDFTPKPSPRSEPDARSWQPETPEAEPDPLEGRLSRALQAGAQLVPGVEGKDAAAEAPRDDQDRTKSRIAKREAPVQRPAPGAYDFDAKELAGKLAPAPAAPSSVLDEAQPAISRAGSYRRSVPRESLPWTDAAYQPPRLDPDSPAAAAEGYRFTLHAPGRHAIEADGKARRVPVFRHAFSVRPIYKVAPGRSKQAYLLARVKNDTGRPILRGHANVFVGGAFSGRSWLNTALPGRVVELALGVDDAVKVERHIQQKTVVDGVVFKDDVSEYTVTIELENNHRYPVDVEVVDQLPVATGSKVEVEGFRADPPMQGPDKSSGRVSWSGSVPGGKVKKLTFRFRVVRPKDWEVHQHGG